MCIRLGLHPAQAEVQESLQGEEGGLRMPKAPSVAGGAEGGGKSTSCLYALVREQALSHKCVVWLCLPHQTLLSVFVFVLGIRPFPCQ